MDQCPACGQSLQDARVVCGHCGEALPLRVIVVSEGSHGGGFALVVEEPGSGGAEERGSGGAKVTEGGSYDG